MPEKARASAPVGAAASAPARQARRPRWRRWLHRSLVAAVLFAVFASSALWIATRPSMLARIVAWRLSAALEGDVTISAIHLLGEGRLRVDNLQVRARGWPGPAGEVVSVGQIRAQIDTSALWSGRVELQRFEMIDSRLRIAERADEPTVINLLSLNPLAERGDAQRALPSIEIPDVLVEFGELLPDGAFQLRGSTNLSGELRLAPGSSTEYLVRLTETIPDGLAELPGGMKITGNFDRLDGSVSLELGRLRFDGRFLAFLPRAAREWLSRLDYSGEVERASLHLTRDQPVSATLVLGRSELQMPLDTGLNWMIVRRGRMEPATGRPRIGVRGGTITMKGSAVRFERIDGLIATSAAGPWLPAMVPLRIDLDIPDLTEFTWGDRSRWLDETLSTAAFSGRIQLLDFAVGISRPDEAIELPYAVADVLDAFRLTRWKLTADMRIRRDGPIFDAGGRPVPQPVRYKGRAELADAQLQYEKFPYPLRGVRGIMTFDEESIVLESLRGVGRTGGEFLLSGRIAPPGPYSGFDMSISGVGVPINDQLRRALPSEARAVVDTLLHRPSLDSLAEAGLLPDDPALRRMRAEAATMLAGLDPGSQEARAAAGRLAAIERQVEAGPMVPGGTLSFDVDVSRPVGGPTMPMSLTGTIDLAGASGAFEYFPYPFRITKGSILLKPDAVELGSGVELVTAGGGVGRVEGRVDLPPHPDGSIGFVPDLRITVVGERVNPILLASIPPSQPDMEAIREAGLRWPGSGRSDAADLLEAIALRGEVEGRATITTGKDDSVDWKVVVSLLDASAMPTPRLEDLLSGSRLLWPRELALADLSATVNVDADRLLVENVLARVAEATLEARGEINVIVEPPTVLAQATLKDLHLHPWMVSLAPEQDRSRLAELWRRLDPAGSLDARLEIAVEEGVAETSLDLAPKTIEATLSGHRVAVSRRTGDLTMSGRGVRLNGLGLEILTDDADHGSIELDGVLPDGRSPGQIEGSWTRARFDCPVIEESLRLAGLEESLRLAEDLKPTGAFEATFSVNLAPDWAVVHHTATVTPRDLGLVLGGERLNLHFADGAVISNERQILLEDLRGRHDDGSFSIDGQVDLGPERVATIDLSVESTSFSAPFRAMLPSTVGSALSAVDLELGEGFDAQGRLLLRSTPDGWWSSWNGPIAIRNGSMNPGVAVTEIDGRVVVQASGGGDQEAEMRLDLLLDGLRVLGRRVESAVGVLELDPPQANGVRRFRLRTLRGSVFGGMAEVFGTVDPSPDGEFEIGLAIAGAGLAGLEGLDSGVELPRTARAEGDEGRIRAFITIAGSANDRFSRRGRGQMHLDDARIADMPIMMALLQLTQLMIPLRGSLSEGIFEFRLLGDELTFDRLLLSSETVEMVGRGTLDVASMNLRVQLEPRGRLPLLSELVSPLSGNLWAIEVTGPLTSPSASLVPLPTLQAILVPSPGSPGGAAIHPDDPRALRPNAAVGRVPDRAGGQAAPAVGLQGAGPSGEGLPGAGLSGNGLPGNGAPNAASRAVSPGASEEGRDS